MTGMRGLRRWVGAKRRSAAIAALLSIMAAPVAAKSPNVVVTVKPIHAIVAGVMQGVGHPALLLPDGASPHAYVMRPSDALLLKNAHLILWVGDELESFLDKPLMTLPKKAAVVELLRDPGIRTLKVRAGGIWAPDAGERSPRNDRRASTHDRRHHEIDPHFWLDPGNARAVANRTAASLAEIDPANAARYRANASNVVDSLKRLEQDLDAALAPVRRVPYIVFHDSYQYFERRFGLNAVGSITLSPERKPGARRLSEIRRRIVGKDVHCVFAEPQFKPSLVETVVRGTTSRSGVLDPLGTAVVAAPDAYGIILRNIADALRQCLSDAS